MELHLNYILYLVAYQYVSWYIPLKITSNIEFSVVKKTVIQQRGTLEVA